MGASGASGVDTESIASHPSELQTPLGSSGTGSVLSATITGADLEINNIGVTLSGPSGPTGSLTITLNGTNRYSFNYNNGSCVGAGAYQVAVPRPSVPPDTYTSITAQWNVGSGVASAPFNLTRSWWVIGPVRHSQYNIPYESACTGTLQTAWTYNTSCQFTQVQLKSDFVMQTEGNGTGASLSYGILKYDDGSCRNNYPQGANSSNSLRPVSSITGSCNVTLIAGDSVATNPNPFLITSYKCADDILLVTSGNGTQAIKHAEDNCPACSTGFNGTNGHIDDFSSSQACTAHGVGDYGNFWTADTR